MNSTLKSLLIWMVLIVVGALIWQFQFSQQRPESELLFSQFRAHVRAGQVAEVKFTGNRIAVRFEYEFRDDAGQWYRAHGNENWEFDANGLMARRFASINDQPIAEADRKFHWPQGQRPTGEPRLSDLDL